MSKKRLADMIKKCYSTWAKTYYDEYCGAEARYPPIHKKIITKILRESKIESLLDAGCGPASFLRDISREGFDLYGFDLTPEMVREGQRVIAQLGYPADRIWQGSVLRAKTFHFPGSKKSFKFDATISIGVLPHIPQNKTSTFFNNLKNSVKKGGLVIIEARNQLFSLYTLNRYSYQFFMRDLIKAEQLKKKAGQNRARLLKAFDNLEKQFRIDLPLKREGKNGEPGYDEVLSLTHNPLVLKESFIEAGFRDVKILFYHYHCLPPILSSTVPEIFYKQSLAMEDPYDWRGYFMASAFLLTGRR